MRSAFGTCDAKAAVEFEGKWLCKKCAAEEKGRLEESEKALKRASKKVKCLLNKLSKVKAVPYPGSYRVAMKTDLMEDDV